jgi:hypothetical protein
LPSGVAENVRLLNLWQKDFTGDSFDFDYHMMWEHIKDAGYANIAKIIFDDMQNLDRIGLNGMVSCQVQRAAFPTGLVLNMMADGLWDKKADYNVRANHFYLSAFDAGGLAVREYLEELSELLHFKYIRNEVKPDGDETFLNNCLKAIEHVLAFESTINTNIESSQNENIQKSWIYLEYHAEYTKLFAKALYLRYSGDTETMKKAAREFYEFLRKNEMILNTVLDVNNTIGVLGGHFGNVD